VTRRLIVNADDFGRSPGVNAGVIAAHAGGIVTTASLMVRWPAAAEAAAYAGLGLGLHVDLGEWRRVDGTWEPVYEVVDLRDADAVAAEISRQIRRFVELVGRPPTHLDSHQHVHREEPVRTALADTGAALGVPVRELTPRIRYCGSFYGAERIDVEALLGVLAALPEGVTELGCHPGLGADHDSEYDVEREQELRTLCDPRVRALIDAEAIELVTFA
jgi:predicted glycoside hydrolase/deacetylase ChbG (UPF0249 family)